MKLSIYSLFLLLFLSSACNLDEDDPELAIESFEQLFIQEISRNAITFMNFTYNDEDQLISKRQFTETGELQYTTTFEYLETKTRTTRKTEDTGALLIYEYYAIDDLTTRRDRLNEDGSLNSYDVYEYEDAEACLYHKRTSFTADDNFDGDEVLAFTSNNCSYISTTNDINNKVLFRKTITIDGKNRYDNALIIPAFPKRHGNITGFDFEDVNSPNVEARTYTSSYEYNRSDYPIKQTRFYSAGDIEELLFIY